MNPLTILIVAFAASRLTRLVVHDSITEPLREWVFRRWPASDTQFGDSEVEADGTNTFGSQVGVLRGTGVEVLRTQQSWVAAYPRFIGNMISCHWCTGIWVAIAVWAAAWFYPVTVPYFAALAIAEVIGHLNDR